MTVNGSRDNGAAIVPLLVAALLGGTTACAHRGLPAAIPTPALSVIAAPAPTLVPVAARSGPSAAPCGDCSSLPLSSDVQRAIEGRLADLKARGGECSVYGDVLERSLASGRITLRPFMWRVGASLASGEARPGGEMTLAREIDSLNVGVRTVADVVWSVEHEAVHIAFQIPSGTPGNEAKTDEHVSACRASRGS